jgi:hypothetical protein
MNTTEKIDTSGWVTPPCGVVSTKSSMVQWTDESYFGARTLKDSDCGGYPDNRVRRNFHCFCSALPYEHSQKDCPLEVEDDGPRCDFCGDDVVSRECVAESGSSFGFEWSHANGKWCCPGPILGDSGELHFARVNGTTKVS